MPHFYPMDMTPVMWAAMLLVPVLVVGALVWFGVFLVRRLTDRSGTLTPLTILEERFARGEMGEEEFERRAEVLRRPHA
jgi:putative membrane protein